MFLTQLNIGTETVVSSGLTYQMILSLLLQMLIKEHHQHFFVDPSFSTQISHCSNQHMYILVVEVVMRGADGTPIHPPPQDLCWFKRNSNGRQKYSSLCIYNAKTNCSLVRCPSIIILTQIEDNHKTSD